MSLELKNVNYIYSEGTEMAVHALSDINLSIGDNEFIGIIGHTGSGKSTLMQHMNGILKATSGEILFNGRNIYEKGFSLRELRNHVGLVFQYPEHQLFEISVFDDVCFGPKNQGLSGEELKARAREALEAVGLDEKYYTYSPFDLSGGQKRRAAIAGVLAMRPQILILDEPTAGLDPGGRTEILDRISKLRRELNMTILLVSHSMEDVAEYVDRIIVMNDGRVEYDDTPREVFKHIEELEKMGLSAPEVSYIVRDLKKAGLDIDDGLITTEEARDAIIRALKRV